MSITDDDVENQTDRWEKAKAEIFDRREVRWAEIEAEGVRL